jgi:CheY-like chemotaxis protein
VSASSSSTARASRVAALQSVAALVAAVAVLLVLAVVTGGIVVPSVVALAAFALPSLTALRSRRAAAPGAEDVVAVPAPVAKGGGGSRPARPAPAPRVAEPAREPDAPPVVAFADEPEPVAVAAVATPVDEPPARGVVDATPQEVELTDPRERNAAWEPGAGQLAGAGAARADMSHMEQRTILLVDDEDALRRFCARILERAGFKVLQAQTGAEALGLVASGGVDVDLLLTDVVMPEMSGLDVAGHLLGEQPGMKVIYVSGYAEDTVQRHGVDRDADGVAFLPKPFKSTELLDAVNAMFAA